MRPDLPFLPPSLRSVLDIGCGPDSSLERWLPPETPVVGIDVDLSIISKNAGTRYKLVCGTAEALPFADGSFDFVISKVAMPYVNIPVSLREIHRVLVPGGTIWISLHEVSMALRRISRDLSRIRIADMMYQLYAIGNGYCLDTFGRQFHWMFNRSRIESTQTVSGMAKALGRVGFTDVRFDRDQNPIFAMSARKI